MRDNLIIIRNEFMLFLASTAILGMMMGLVYIDINGFNNGLHEASLTEISQELILGAIAALFFYQAKKQARLRGSLVLVGGFYACMLIREMDFLFDALHHGAWLWFALAVTLVCGVMAARHPLQTLAGLAHLLRHRAWQMMAAGLLTTLVFSRLFGMESLWQQLMLAGYVRTVKNMAEEGTELLGYSLCLVASLRYTLTLPQRVVVFDSERASARWQNAA